tara:strand:+ start:767 stop:1471 length:705 start_codon:yes stop_codon:yes gene_type:complete
LSIIYLFTINKYFLIKNKDMQYRIIITANNKKKKILQKSNDLNTIKKKYFKIKDKNKVLYPKQTSAYLKTKPVKYEIILMKKWGENDIPFVDRDILGRTIEVKDITKKWTIIHKDEYSYEETFTVFGQDKRLNCIEIIKSILMKKQKTVVIKQVNYIENKLLIHQDNDFDVVLCKCPKDSERLYKILKEFTEKNKIKHIMFTGSVKLSKTETYKMIVEKTGWKRNKVYRTVTRP